MKIKTTITEISHEELVILLGTAHCYSEWLLFEIRESDYYGTELEDESDSNEDKWAKVLLAGKSINAYDYYAEEEDDFYGYLPHDWNEEHEAMRYELNLEDITKGLGRAWSSDSNIRKYIYNWTQDNGDFDDIQAEAVMQFIIFGKEIYG